MGTSRRAFAMLAVIALVSGCFGYNKSAKRWSYAGNSVLIAGGGAAIAADLLSSDAACADMQSTGVACRYSPPINGALVAGIVLVTAGVIGIVINATRPNVRTSR
jgi:hypothetical protein